MKNILIAFTFLSFAACQPQQEVHVSGSIQPQSTGLLGLNIKNKIAISFNGYEVMTGYLTETNNADLVGLYNGKEVTAKCSGAETITCVISHDNRKTSLNFRK